MRYTYAQTLSPIAVVARMFQMYRDEAEKAGYEASPDQLAWSNTDLRRRDRREGDARGAAASRSAHQPLPQDADRDAAAAGLQQHRVGEAHPRREDHRQAADARRPGAQRRGHRRQPEHGAREARRVSGPRRLQHLADQDPVRHAARRHDARQHDGAIAEEILPHFRNRLPQATGQARQSQAGGGKWRPGRSAA